MKVLLATFLYEKSLGGGVSAVVRELAKALTQRGIEVVVIATSMVRNVQFSYEEGVRIYRLPPYNLYWVGDKNRQPAWKKALWQGGDLWNPRIYAAARSIIAQEKPDVVHVHKLRGLSTAIWTAARWAGVKHIIHTCHDHELLSPEGTFSGRIGRLAYANEKAVWLYTLPRAWLARHVHIVTAPSQFTLNLHIKRGFFSRADRRVVANSHGFTRQQLSSMQGGKHSVSERVNLLYIGRLEKFKGLETLCRSVEIASARQANLHLRIAGYGSLVEMMQNRYKDSTHIEWCGPVSGDAKERLFEDCDLAVAPSELHENSPITILEAYAHGKPVIASCVGGIPEIITEGKTGFLLPPGEVDIWAAKIEEVSRNPVILRNMRPDCLDAAQEFTIEEMLENYLAIYTEAPAW